MRPPIPEPNGRVAPLIEHQSRVSSDGISVRYHKDFAVVLRQSIKEIFLVIANIMVIFALVSIWTLVLFPVFQRSHRSPPSFEPTFFQLWILGLYGFIPICVLTNLFVYLFQSNRDRIAVLTPYGLIEQDNSKRVGKRWTNFLWIVHWTGDVLFCTFGGATFVPREAFSSHQEAQAFLQIARELHKSRGAAWRDEWNGKTFGPNA